MLQEFTWLDATIAVIFLLYFLAGIRRGFFISLGNLAGFILGAFAAMSVTGWVVQQVPEAWHIIAGIITIILCLVVGQWLGFLLGRSLRDLSDKTPLRSLERLLGGVLNLVVGALVLLIIILALKPLGVPAITTALGQSQIAVALERNVPRAVQEKISEVRTEIMANASIPEITSLMYPQTPPPTEPLENASLEEASQSVVQVLGAAIHCGYTSEGSGFVIADNTVATNAHVVAGVTEPLVQDRGGFTYRGEVVYYDKTNDVAFIRLTDELPLDALPLGGDAPSGTPASFMGYPGGGPFDSRPATVQGLGYSRTVEAKTGETSESRLVYQLAAEVEQGSSGGPVFNEKGEVIAQIFATSTEGKTSGYAIPASVLQDALVGLENYTQPVATGQCQVR
ncbi:MarP family serine protease [Rothia sp. ZJ1223]|uniref:MarP family serine protease n=1 Tax=Rothia sp. ZJ1223 TaxID=2811098 RepID=UPI00195620E9|nr:MarP family serine protease [Rothia sp. ZJ1223]MBM7051977.1 MarP family serine protease [Rothia sp. ZJ1223]